MRRTFIAVLFVAVLASFPVGLSSVWAGGPSATSSASKGVSVSPAFVEHLARKGGVGSVRVTNNTGGTLKFSVTPRPWIQSRSGAVNPSRKRKYTSYVGVKASAFKLLKGTSRTVSVSLKKVPRSGSLYGSLVVVGQPLKKKKKGITAVYRIIGGLRLNPTSGRRKLRLKPGAVGVTRRKSAVMAVRNRGNTVEPIRGVSRFTCGKKKRNGTVSTTRILPGTVVSVRIGSVKKLPKGTCRARGTLLQSGRPIARFNKKFRLR